MSNKRRNRRTAKQARHTPMGRSQAKKRLAANLTEEHEWYLDTPDVRLSRIFTVVLLLHLVAFGGILAFKMVDKASANTSITISSAREAFEDAVAESKALAAEVPGENATIDTEVVEEAARPAPPSPLRRDRTRDDQYKVQAGDTLVEIAAELGIDPAALRAANSIISDNELYPGRWLDLPTQGAAAPAAADATPDVESQPGEASSGEPAAMEPAAPSQPQTYTVAKGDTAWAISRKLRVSFTELMELNGIDRPETLQIGQQLRIPQGR